MFLVFSERELKEVVHELSIGTKIGDLECCLLYTSDAADE